MTDSNDIVTFLDSKGREISNDPRWHARKTLKSEGVDVDQLEAKIAELTAQLQAQNAAAAASEGVEDEDADEDSPYADVKGKDLSALAKERGISLKNDDGSTKKANDVRAELAAQDKA